MEYTEKCITMGNNLETVEWKIKTYKSNKKSRNEFHLNRKTEKMQENKTKMKEMRVQKTEC